MKRAARSPSCPTVRPSDYPSPFSFRSLRDRRPDEVAPLGPRAVVVLHFVDAEQVLEREPRVARPFADPAVGDDLARAVNDLRALVQLPQLVMRLDRKSTRLNSSHGYISYAVFCLKKKKKKKIRTHNKKNKKKRSNCRK